MEYVVTGLSPEPFQHLYGLSDADLAARGVHAVIACETPGYPDRIEVRDAAVGDRMLLLNHVSMTFDSPYRSTYAIFVRDGAINTCRAENHVPDMLRCRLQSLRGFDEMGLLIDAEIADGDAIEPAIMRLLEHRDVAFIHAHNAIPGCYNARIDRL